MADALIIFLKNNEKGKVKTRLAATIGTAKASAIYGELIAHTARICRDLNPEIDIHVYFSSFIPARDEWTDQINITRHTQLQVSDLGERMHSAFTEQDRAGYRKIMIIGTDCPYLKATDIHRGFSILNSSDIVLGPAKDGGFYLLACSDINALQFENIEWSTENVLKQYLDNIEEDNYSFKLLDALEDIDDESSMNRFNTYLKALNYN